eukprot:Gb_35602 [translate_table: standard]
MEEHPLKQINDSLPHRLTLQLWEREEGVLSRRIDQKEARHRNIQNEIYQLLGLYFVFQGVVLTALFQAAAQPNRKTCSCWWSPFVLTVIALGATIGAVLHQFHLQSEIQTQLGEEKEDCRVLFRSIQSLRSKGIRFDLNKPPPNTRLPKVARSFHCWEYWWSYRGAVALILIAFSTITLVSCRVLLCLKKPENNVTKCACR